MLLVFRLRLHAPHHSHSIAAMNAVAKRLLFPAALLLLIAAGLFVAPVVAQSPPTHQHRFDHAEHWARMFDDPQRDNWQKPHQVIETLKLDSRAVVADIGAGTGYFAVRLARMIPAGRVIAADTEPDMVAYLARRARRENLRNLLVIAAEPDDAKLPQPVDLILLVDVYHHIEERQRYFRKLAGSLKPRGRIAIIDFRLDSPDGPPKSARIRAERVKAELEEAGYELLEEHRFLPRQYFLVFRRAG